MQETADLERIISHLDTLHEIGNPCIHPDTKKLVSNSEYDALKSRLRKLSPTSHIFKNPTASIIVASNKMIHKPPMTSIEKANGSLAEKTAELEKWRCMIVDELGYKQPMETWAAQAYKLDGVALSLEYVNGELKQAGLRPQDGINGQDVTEQAKMIIGILAKLPKPYSFIIRGEVICYISIFNAINDKRKQAGEKPYANPRNYTAGSLGLDDPNEVQNRQLTFIAYNIIWTSDKAPYKTEVERAKWCNKEGLGIIFVQIRPFSGHDGLKKLEDFVPNLDYEVDGIVLSVDNLEDQEQMGTHDGTITGNPKGKIAWKFEDEHAHCPTNKIIWATGRTSKITPVAQFDPVQLEGTMVSNATLHSLGNMRRNGIGVGTVLEIIKSGKIIPYARKAVANFDKTPPFPQFCPTCNAPTIVEENTKSWDDEKYTAELYCSNPLCPAAVVSTLIHYLTIVGVKGLGEVAVELLHNQGIVKHAADFYKLTKDTFIKIGFSEREAILNEARIWMLDKPEKNKDDDDLIEQTKIAKQTKIKLPLWQIFASLGIHGAGKAVGRVLQDTFGSMDKIINASKDDLCDIDGIGITTADAIIDYFKINADKVLDLLKFVEPEITKTGKLSGKTFVFTGGFTGGKDFWEKKVVDLGGKTSSSVGKKTDFVVVGTDAGSKLTKAQQLGIKTLTPVELTDMLK